MRRLIHSEMLDNCITHKSTDNLSECGNGIFQIPDWAKYMIELGNYFANNANCSSNHFTLALCLPCVDYAAGFVGIGIIKARLAHSPSESQKERLTSLVGQWVSFKTTRKTDVGILEFCPIEKLFQIKLEKRGLWTVLQQNDWSRVRPTGREFNATRRVSDRQTQKIEDQYRSITTFGDLLECDMWKATLEKSGCIFSIHGNKTRINNELSECISIREEASLGKILRPEGNPEYGESFHCSLHANRSSMNVDEGELAIIEAGRALPDLLASSRKSNRVVLLARNAADYDDCANQIMEALSIGKKFTPEIDFPTPPSIKLVAFYHS